MHVKGKQIMSKIATANQPYAPNFLFIIVFSILLQTGQWTFIYSVSP